MLGLLGYSDDNLCLAPALNALQDMLYTSLSYIPLSAPLYTCHLLTDSELAVTRVWHGTVTPYTWEMEKGWGWFSCPTGGTELRREMTLPVDKPTIS